MKTVFLDIDTQVDFMRPSGALYVPGAHKIVPAVRRLTRLADRCAVPVISTMDWHLRNDPEFRAFPPHCVRATPGAAKIPQTIARSTRQILVRKQKIDVFSNPRLARLLAPYDRCVVYGVAVEYCVKTACLGCRRLGLQTYLVSDATAAIEQKAGVLAKKLLQSKGVKLVSTADVKRRVYGSAAGCR